MTIMPLYMYFDFSLCTYLTGIFFCDLHVFWIKGKIVSAPKCYFMFSWNSDQNKAITKRENVNLFESLKACKFTDQ